VSLTPDTLISKFELSCVSDSVLYNLNQGILKFAFVTEMRDDISTARNQVRNQTETVAFLRKRPIGQKKYY